MDFARHYPGQNPGAMWRARDWRKLLNLIDHLPQNSFYYQALMNDEDHARGVAEWRSAHRDELESKKSKPGWQTWSPEVDRLASIENELRLLRTTLVQVNGGKAKFEPVDRPGSKIEEAQKKVDYSRKLSVYEKLKAKMLPPKSE